MVRSGRFCGILLLAVRLAEMDGPTRGPLRGPLYVCLRLSKADPYGSCRGLRGCRLPVRARIGRIVRREVDARASDARPRSRRSRVDGVCRRRHETEPAQNLLVRRSVARSDAAAHRDGRTGGRQGSTRARESPRPAERRRFAHRDRHDHAGPEPRHGGVRTAFGRRRSESRSAAGSGIRSPGPLARNQARVATNPVSCSRRPTRLISGKHRISKRSWRAIRIRNRTRPKSSCFPLRRKPRTTSRCLTTSPGKWRAASLRRKSQRSPSPYGTRVNVRATLTLDFWRCRGTGWAPR